MRKGVRDIELLFCNPSGDWESSATRKSEIVIDILLESLFVI